MFMIPGSNLKSTDLGRGAAKQAQMSLVPLKKTGDKLFLITFGHMQIIGYTSSSVAFMLRFTFGQWKKTRRRTNTRKLRKLKGTPIISTSEHTHEPQELRFVAQSQSLTSMRSTMLGLI